MADRERIRLTQHAKSAGCAAKQPQEFLLKLLGSLPPIDDPNVLVGHATSDDAAVYRLSDDLALILTTDFFTPIVDDAYDFGAVAAANALSDVYAMAGTPLSALSLVGFPAASLDPSVLGDILRGAADIAKQAGISIVGGHTIESQEPIFGLSVVGRVDPRKMITNAGARAGDALVLTKPLGLGVITTAAKRGEDRLNAIDAAIGVMKTLNRDAARIIAEAGAHALTDVTGYGLLGHLRNMLSASGVGATVYADRVPILEPARAYVAAGIAPGGTYSNRKFVLEWVRFERSVSNSEQLLLCDAQTSGGLLTALPADVAQRVVTELHAVGLSSASVVGSVRADQPGRIDVISSRDRGFDSV